MPTARVEPTPMEPETGASAPTENDELLGRVESVLTEVAGAIHAELGTGRDESVYRAAVERALRAKGLGTSSKDFPVWDRGRLLGHHRSELVVENATLVEVRTKPELFELHEGWLSNHLRVAHMEVGLVVNFGREVTWRRVRRRPD